MSPLSNAFANLTRSGAGAGGSSGPGPSTLTISAPTSATSTSATHAGVSAPSLAAFSNERRHGPSGEPSTPVAGRGVPSKQRSTEACLHNRKPSSGTRVPVPISRPPGMSSPGTAGMGIGTGGTPEERLIDVLVTKALAKVAARTAEHHLPPAETDEVIRQSCGSLFQMCRSSLSYVVYRLLIELDQPMLTFSAEDPFYVSDRLRAQLRVVTIISMAVYFNWNLQRETKGKAGPAQTVSSAASTSAGTEATSVQLRNAADPEPLDEKLAKSLVETIGAFLRQFKRFEDAGGSTAVSSYPTASTAGELDNSFGSRDDVAGWIPKLAQELQAHICKIAHYVSASNWAVVISRLHNRIGYWCGPDDNLDRSEIRLLEFCSLNRARVGHVLRELAAQFMHLKRQAQIEVAEALRKAIWSWIEAYPDEFAELVESNVRIEGAPDTLFDHAAGLGENQKKRLYLWPMQTMLLVVCPDVISKITRPERGPRLSQTTTRKADFLASLKKHMKGTKLADVATGCCNDLVRAASFLPESHADDVEGLRMLSIDLMHELGHRLLDPLRPPTNAEGRIQTPLISEYIASVARLDKSRINTVVLQRCLSETSQPAFQLAFIEACHNLASVGKHAAWNYGLEDLYPVVAVPIRKLFMLAVLKGLDVAADVGGPINLPGLTVTAGEHSDRNELLRAILNLWRHDPRLAFHRPQAKGTRQDSKSEPLPFEAVLAMGVQVDPDQLQQMVYMLTRLLDHRNHGSIRHAALSTLRSIYENRTLHEPDAPSSVALAASRPWVGFSLSRALLDTWDSAAEERSVLCVLESWQTRLSEALARLGPQSEPEEASKTFLGAHRADWLLVGDVAKVASTLAMCTVDPYNLARATTIYRRYFGSHVVQIARGVGVRSSVAEILQRSDLFQDPMVAHEPQVPESRAAQVKRARTLLRLGTERANMTGVWDEAFRRWRVLGSQLHHRRIEHAVVREDASWEQDPVPAWLALSNLLAMMASKDLSTAASTAQSMPNTPAGLMPAQFSTPANRPKQADTFIQEMVDMLVADDLQTREGVKDALGIELDASLVPVLLKHLRTIVDHFFVDDVPRPQPPYTHFLEQTLYMLRLFLDRMTGPLDTATKNELTVLLLDFARYTNKLGSMPESQQSAVKIKYWMAQMCELGSRRECFPHADAPIRLLDYQLGWAAEVHLMPCSTLEEQARSRADRDLLLACLRGMAPLLVDLKITPRHLDYVESDDSKVYVRSYSRYRSFFLGVFRAASTVESAALRSQKPTADARFDSSSGLRSAGETEDEFAHKQSVATRELADVAQIRTHGTACFVNLIGANLNPAYRFGPTMILDDDPSIRQVGLRIIEASLSGQPSELRKVPEGKPQGNIERMLDMLCAPGLYLTLAVCQVCSASDYEDMAEALLNLFASRGKLVELLVAVIEHEVAITEQESSLFRGNTFTTRLLTVFAKTKGYEYLRETLAPMLYSIATKPAEYIVDFDPHRHATDGDEQAALQQVENVEFVTGAFLTAIKASWSRMPVEIREICHHISVAVERKFPDSQTTAVGGFVFLRFINPAIVNPEVIDLDIPDATRDIQRSLVMITRVLQALANNVRFGAKDSAMKALNDFMGRNIWGMNEFLRSCSRAPDQDLLVATLAAAQADTALDDADRYVVHSFLWSNSAKIGTELMVQAKRNPARDSEATKQVWKTITEALDALGDPSYAECDLPFHCMSPSSYLVYLTYHSLRRAPDPGPWRPIFFKAPLAKGPTETYVFLAAGINAVDADLEGFFLHVLQTMDSADKTFNLFVDCTGFMPRHEIPAPWLKSYFELFSLNVQQNLSGIVFLNPNNLARRYLRKVLNPDKWERRWTHMIKTASSLTELAEFLPNYQDVLPESSWKLHEEPRTSISQVTFAQVFQSQIPVIFSVGQRTLCIPSGKPQDFVADIKCLLVEIINLEDVEEIRRVPYSSPRATPAFTLRLRCGATLRFVTRHTDRILDILAAVRESGPCPQRIGSFGAPTCTSSADGAGIVIASSLLNLCSSDPQLRLSAVKVLQMLAGTVDSKGLERLKSMMPSGHIPQMSDALMGSLSASFTEAFSESASAVLENLFAGIPRITSAELSVLIYAFRPWLLKLTDQLRSRSGPDPEIKSSRVRVILRNLLRLTLTNLAVRGTLVSRVWPALARQQDLIPFMIDELVRAATACNPRSNSFVEACEVAAAMTSNNLQAKLLHRLRRALGRTSLIPISSLVESTEWLEITALARMEMVLAFDSPFPVALHLADILHVCTMIVGTGSSSSRRVVHSLVLNCVASLLLGAEGQTDVDALRQIAGDLAGPRMQACFGLVAAAGDEDEESELRSPISAASYETIVEVLVRLVNVGAPNQDLANRWRARWVGLVTASCFQSNPALQPRSFITLGLLVTEAVDEDLCYQVFSMLRPVLLGSSGPDSSLCTAVLGCMEKLVRGLSGVSQYQTSAFWIGLGLMIGSDMAVYSFSLKLCRTAAAALLEDPQRPQDMSLSQILLSYRDEASCEVWDSIEEIAGIRFDDVPEGDEGIGYFGFALVAVLLKGLRNHQISHDAEAFLRTLLAESLRHGIKVNGSSHRPEHVSREALPFFVALLPIAARTNSLPSLFAQVQVPVEPDVDIQHDYRRIISAIGFADQESAILVLATLVSMVSSADSDSEVAFCFGLMAEILCTEALPDVMLLVQSELMPKMQEILRTSDDVDLVRSCHILMFAPLAQLATGALDRLIGPEAETTDLHAVLYTLRFPYLLQPNRTFQSADTLTKLTKLYVELVSAAIGA